MPKLNEKQIKIMMFGGGITFGIFFPYAGIIIFILMIIL